jgi:hypothetical protein
MMMLGKDEAVTLLARMHQLGVNAGRAYEQVKADMGEEVAKTMGTTIDQDNAEWIAGMIYDENFPE